MSPADKTRAVLDSIDSTDSKVEKIEEILSDVATPFIIESMTFKAVNSAETTQDLQKCIETLADEDGYIQGRRRKFDAIRMAENCKSFIADKTDTIPATVMTREFGIRQQAIYIKYCLEHE